MSNEIGQFARELRGGVRGNRYSIILNLPGGISGDMRTFSMMARAVNKPGMETGIITVPYAGHETKISGDQRASGEWSITAMLNNSNDKALAVRIAEQWRELSANSQDPDEYKSDGEIRLLSPGQGNPEIMSWKIEGVWVSNSGELNLSQDAVDEILTFDMSLQYDNIYLV